MMIKYLLYPLIFLPVLIMAQTDLSKLSKKGIDIEGHIPMGLEVGEQAPEINLTDVNGQLIRSSVLLKEKQVVVIFYRGKWCPVCERYLSNLNDSLAYIRENNAEVLVIGPETFENAREISDETHADFVLLPDTSFQVLQAFDVMFQVTKGYVKRIKTFKMTDIAENNNQEVAQLPVPATYIIGRDGKIKWRHFNYNYSIRASAKEIIEQLKD